MKRTVKFFGIFALSIIAYACSNEMKLEKRVTKERQAQIDSCILKITDYAFTEIYDCPIDKITLKGNKLKVFTTTDGKPKAPYDVERPTAKIIFLRSKTGYLNFTTYFYSNPWVRLPNIEIKDNDSIYLVTIQEVGFEYPYGYIALKELKEKISFDKKGNKIETPSAEQ